MLKHGSRNRPCTGSGSIPVDGSVSEIPLSQIDSSAGCFSLSRLGSQDSSRSLSSAAGVSRILPAVNNHSLPQARPFDHPSRCGPTIKRIPKANWKPCAQLLSSLISDVVNNIGSHEKWNNLMAFTPGILLKPKRGGKRRNLSREINDRIARWPNDMRDPQLLDQPPPGRQLSSDQGRAKTVMAKIEDGNLRATVRIICSDDAMAQDSEETLGALRAKHPAAPDDCQIISA